MSMKFNGVICYFEINVADINKIKQAKNCELFYSFSFIKKKKKLIKWRVVRSSLGGTRRGSEPF